MKRSFQLSFLLILLCLSVAAAAGQELRTAGGAGSTYDQLVVGTPVLSQANKSFDENGDRIFENLSFRMASAGPREKIPVIVLFKERTPSAGTYAARLSSITGVRALKAYKNLPAVATSLTGEQIRKLSRDSWVESVQLDGRTRASMFTAELSFGVVDLQAQFHPPDFHFIGDRDGILGNYSKNDVVVAVTDTGINANHPDLKNKVLAWSDYVNGQANPYDDNGHGTEVSGIIAGAGKKDFDFSGVAFEAALVALKVLDNTGSGSESNIISAIDDVITNRTQFNIRVLNISIEVQGSSNGKDAFSQICNRAVSAGIVVVIAAGNFGPNARTIGDGAASNSAITVGAGADLGEQGFYLADFSSRGPTADGRIKPDLWGPGVRIHTTSKGGGYVDATGTSFSSPFVAGVAAIMISANPNLRPAAIKSILTSTTVPWGAPRRNNEAGFGRLQVYQAGTRAAGITQNLDPPHVPRAGFASRSLSPGQADDYPMTITTKSNIALTLIILNHPAADLDLYLLDDKGNVLAQGISTRRQETVTFHPTRSGAYTVRVKSTSNSAPSGYVLNISADWSQ